MYKPAADTDVCVCARSYMPLVALHELFNAISHYWETCQNQDDKAYLLTLMGTHYTHPAHLGGTLLINKHNFNPLYSNWKKML